MTPLSPQREGYRHEYIYKAAPTHKILLGKHSLHSASVINEFRVGECKADVAILNGTATVYEVKSERDSLAWLERQIRANATVFAKVYVIASESHIQAVLTAPTARRPFGKRGAWKKSLCRFCISNCEFASIISRLGEPDDQRHSPPPRCSDPRQ